MDYASVYKSVAKSVVNVVQLDQNSIVCSTASGMVIDDGRKVLTCSHCCSDIKSTAIYETTSGAFIKGTIVFDDQENDIAILEFSNVISDPVCIGDSKSLEIGNEGFVIGFPYVFGSEKTLTVGHVAAFEEGLIKLDTSVNNGNSGGPLFNKRGEVVGIVNAKLGSLSNYLKEVEKQNSGVFIRIACVDPIQVIKQIIHELQLNLNLGIGYAIPIDKVKALTNSIHMPL